MSEKVISPIVNSDRSVTINLETPKNIKKVGITGDFILGQKEVIPILATSIVPMNKVSGNVWTITTEKNIPGIYRYAFNVDGLKMIDPLNHWMRRIEHGQPFSMVKVPGDEPQPWDLIKEIPHGTVVRETMYSETLKDFRYCNIYLPPNYNPAKKYPIFYLLHGGGNDYANWLYDGTADRIMDYQIAKGKAKEMIVAMPDGNVMTQEDMARMLASARATAQKEDWAAVTARSMESVFMGHLKYFVNDVMPFVESKYSINGSRAIAGLSMGAMQTYNLITASPELFNAAGLFSGGPPDQGARISAVKDQLEKYEIIYSAVGNVDKEEVREGMKSVQSLMDELGVPNKYFETMGGHIWAVWQRALVNFVELL
ncbi:MAG: alpha/beta hydrolase-fold protein [Promethearchaeota archaeon]